MRASSRAPSRINALSCQDLALADKKHMFMTVILLRSFDGGDKKIMRVVAPLGMLVPGRTRVESRRR